MNPRQNALLELKLAGLRRTEYPDFFQLFGRDPLQIRDLYAKQLRGLLVVVAVILGLLDSILRKS